MEVYEGVLLGPIAMDEKRRKLNQGKKSSCNAVSKE